MVLFFAILTLVFIFAYTILNGFKFDKNMAFILIMIYGLFLISTSFYALYQIFI